MGETREHLGVSGRGRLTLGVIELVLTSWVEVRGRGFDADGRKVLLLSFDEFLCHTDVERIQDSCGASLVGEAACGQCH